MIKLLRHKVTNNWFVKDYSTGYVKKFDSDQKKEAMKDYRRLKRNAYGRAKTQILRELCGTSARQVKIDMGL